MAAKKKSTKSKKRAGKKRKVKVKSKAKRKKTVSKKARNPAILTVAKAPQSYKLNASESSSARTPYFASISYLFQLLNLLLVGTGAVISLIIYFISKKPFTKFHALQSAFLGILVSLLVYVLRDSMLNGTPLLSPAVYPVVYPVIGILVVLVMFILSVKTYKNQWIKLPLFGDLAMKFI